MIDRVPSPVKRFVPRRVKNWLRPLLARRVPESQPAFHYPAPGMRPKTLSVEPTSRCNLNCPFCLVGLQNSLPSTEHDLLPRGMGMLDFGLYEKIARDAAEFGIETMQLHFQGEPLLHKRFPDMARVAKQYGMRTQVFTNGLALTEAYAKRVLDSGLDMMRFSVDGATEETYQKNRVGGKFERVYKNMATMARLARERNSPIRLEWQLIGLRNNEHEVPLARKMAEDIGIHFFVKTFAVTDPELVPLNPQYHRRMHIKPCLDIYRAIFVYWTGDVVVCCYDQSGENIVGNLKHNTLTEIWDGPAYVELRRRIDRAYTYPEDEPAMCKSCLKWSHEPWRTSDGKTVWGQGAGAQGYASSALVADDDLV